MLQKQNKLYQDPQVSYPIDDLHLSFDDYIKKCKTIITENRQDLQNNAEKIIAANAPYELRPVNTGKIRRGALLIHGLLDSPFCVKDIANQLHAEGILVRAVLLPGHGTVPG